MVSVASPTSETVRWHEAECGRYGADLPVWRALAGDVGREVLDLGCGSGRVALTLAGDGHRVTAVDCDAALLSALDERARALPVETVRCDIRALSFGRRRWPLVIVPMQTVQLLGGEAGRAQLFAGVRRHLEDDGELAIAIVTSFQAFDRNNERPTPDTVRADDAVYVSTPVAVRVEDGAITVERDRRIYTPDGPMRPVEHDVIRLDIVDVDSLAAEGARHGLRLERVIGVGETEEHVANEVVVFRAER